MTIHFDIPTCPDILQIARVRVRINKGGCLHFETSPGELGSAFHKEDRKQDSPSLRIRKVIFQMKQIRILIADDHAVTRDGLKAILEAEKEFKVVAIAQNGEEALRKIAETSPDAILLDGDMPKLNGLQVMELTKEKMENACFLLLSSYHDDRLALEALKKGATGFLLKDWEKEDITRAVQACARGIMIFPDSIAPAAIAHSKKREGVPFPDGPGRRSSSLYGRRNEKQRNRRGALPIRRNDPQLYKLHLQKTRCPQTCRSDRSVQKKKRALVVKREARFLSNL